jgi:hypothetical protein
MSFKIQIISLIFVLACSCQASVLKKSLERKNVAGSRTSPERVLSISTKTDDCFQCGMLEGFGYLDVKVTKQPTI